MICDFPTFARKPRLGRRFTIGLERTAFALLLFLILRPSLSARAGTTIVSPNNYAYSANLGWIDGSGDGNNGGIVGEYVCSGYFYGANIGWINLGSGFPTNGIQYRNLSADDFGVNLDSVGNLSGCAWGANIGWIVFTNGSATGPLSAADSPRVNMATGRLGGYAYSANCGWISLSNTTAYLQTYKIQPAALATDGLPIPWLLQNFGTTNVDANADPDGDGSSNAQEYFAGTNPNDGNDFLRITYVAYGDIVPGFTTLHWTAVPSRYYSVQNRLGLDTNAAWADAIGYSFGVSNSTFKTGNTNFFEFYRIRAYRPLGP